METVPDIRTGPGAPILLEGTDVLPLLHRISTQRLDDLGPEDARMTIFCNPRGGMLHRAAVVRTPTGVWLLRDDAPAEALAAFVDRHVFRDKVRLVAPPPGLEVCAVPGGFGLSAGSIEARDGVPVRVQVESAYGLAVVAAGSGPDPGAECARIRAGWPRHGGEIIEELNPFDIGRAHEVHLNKGCYTGQESLLRLVTYGGVRRGLARLAGEGVPPAVPGALFAGGREVGRVTSAAADGAAWIGLAVLPREAAAETAAVALEDGRPAHASGFPDAGPLGLPG